MPVIEGYSITMKNLLISLVVIAASVTTGSANLIFSDNFNTANTGLNDDLATRQTGSLGQTNWLVGYDTSGVAAGASIDTNRLLLSTGANTTNVETNVTPDQDFAMVPALLVGGSFKVAFDVTPAGSYAGFSLGATTADLGVRSILSEDSDFSLLLNPNGSVGVRAAGVTTHSQADINWNGRVELTVTTTDFSTGTPFTVDMTVGGTPINLTGTGPTFNGTWDVNGTNYMILSDRNALFKSTFDNFAVTAIPEPSTLLLVLIPVLSFVALRRRK